MGARRHNSNIKTLHSLAEWLERIFAAQRKKQLKPYTWVS
jgi:hypothetical protein